MKIRYSWDKGSQLLSATPSSQSFSSARFEHRTTNRQVLPAPVIFKHRGQALGPTSPLITTLASEVEVAPRLATTDGCILQPGRAQSFAGTQPPEPQRSKVTSHSSFTSSSVLPIPNSSTFPPTHTFFLGNRAMTKDTSFGERSPFVNRINIYYTNKSLFGSNGPMYLKAHLWDVPQEVGQGTSSPLFP